MNRRMPHFLTAVVCLALLSCSKHESAPPKSSAFPIAITPSRVGTYPALTKSGGGHFYDEVLEYRVWVHQNGGDNFRAFSTYEQADAFSKQQKGAENPLVLVLQHEHVNEPTPGHFEHVKGDRITEWQVQWLRGAKRGPDSIPRFLESKRNGADR